MRILFAGDGLIDGDNRILRNFSNKAHNYTILSLRNRIHFNKVNNYDKLFTFP